MKQSFSLYSDFSRYHNLTYTDYTLTYGRSDYLICGDFVRAFLKVAQEPPYIKFTYNTKNPKEKGYKKISIRPAETSYGDLYNKGLYNVFISGRKWKKTDFFPNMLGYFPESFDSLDVWVKIEITN